MTKPGKTGRFGLTTYARILAIITAQPSTHSEVAASFDRGNTAGQSMREILHRMCDLRIAHITGWRTPENKRGILRAVFAAGPGVNAPYPRPLNKPQPGSTLARNNPRPELVAFASVIRALKSDDGVSRADLQAATGIAPMRLSLLLKQLRADKLIHRSGWAERTSGNGVAAELFTLGAGRDTPRAAPMPRSEIGARSRRGRQAKAQTLRIIHALAGTSERLAV